MRLYLTAIVSEKYNCVHTSICQGNDEYYLKDYLLYLYSALLKLIESPKEHSLWIIIINIYHIEECLGSVS